MKNIHATPWNMGKALIFNAEIQEKKYTLTKIQALINLTLS